MGISKQQDDQEFEQDFTKEPIVHAQKSNSIIIEGKQISMGQFYEEADLSNIQTSSDVHRCHARSVDPRKSQSP